MEVYKTGDVWRCSVHLPVGGALDPLSWWASGLTLDNRDTYRPGVGLFFGGGLLPFPRVFGGIVRWIDLASRTLVVEVELYAGKPETGSVMLQPDDRPAIQRAIDAAAATTRKLAYLPTGEYSLGVSLWYEQVERHPENDLLTNQERQDRRNNGRWNNPLILPAGVALEGEPDMTSVLRLAPFVMQWPSFNPKDELEYEAAVIVNAGNTYRERPRDVDKAIRIANLVVDGGRLSKADLEDLKAAKTIQDAMNRRRWRNKEQQFTAVNEGGVRGLAGINFDHAQGVQIENVEARNCTVWGARLSQNLPAAAIAEVEATNLHCHHNG